MNTKIYNYYWQAKIIAWIKRESVFTVRIGGSDKKLLGYIVGKMDTIDEWKAWYESCK